MTQQEAAKIFQKNISERVKLNKQLEDVANNLLLQIPAKHKAFLIDALKAAKSNELNVSDFHTELLKKIKSL